MTGYNDVKRQRDIRRLRQSRRSSTTGRTIHQEIIAQRRYEAFCMLQQSMPKLFIWQQIRTRYDISRKTYGRDMQYISTHWEEMVFFARENNGTKCFSFSPVLSQDFNVSVQSKKIDSLIALINTNLDAIPLKGLIVLINSINLENQNTEFTSISVKELVNLICGNNSNPDYVLTQIIALKALIIQLPIAGYKMKKAPVFSRFQQTGNVRCESVKFTFSKEFFPTLVVIKSFILPNHISTLRFLKTKYGVILYLYMIFQMKSGFRKVADNTVFHTKYLIPFEELRAVTGTKNKYSASKDFKKNVLNPAIKDINTAHAEFLIKIVSNGQRGKSTTHFEFLIRKRTSYLETEYEYVLCPEFYNQMLLHDWRDGIGSL